MHVCIGVWLALRMVVTCWLLTLLLTAVLLDRLYRLTGLIDFNHLEDGSSNTAVIFHHGKLNSLVENNLPFEVICCCCCCCCCC